MLQYVPDATGGNSGALAAKDFCDTSRVAGGHAATPHVTWSDLGLSGAAAVTMSLPLQSECPSLDSHDVTMSLPLQ